MTEENSISVIIVNPRNLRLYNYWINGSLEKRSMLREKMREFCLDLCPPQAPNINRCINDMLPFVIFVDKAEFQELEEEAPEPLPASRRLFPYRKMIYSGKDFAPLKKKESAAEQQGKRFNIWEHYGIFLEKKKSKSESIFKSRIL